MHLNNLTVDHFEKSSLLPWEACTMQLFQKVVLEGEGYCMRESF